jgi:hypothetical protein
MAIASTGSYRLLEQRQTADTRGSAVTRRRAFAYHQRDRDILINPSTDLPTTLSL